MIIATELRIGNLVTWNPKLVHPGNSLPPIHVEVFSISQDRILYVFPNIENRVEPFEDDVVQTGTNYKLLEELEPIMLTTGILENAGFEEKDGLWTSRHFRKSDLQLKFDGDYFQRVSVTGLNSTVFSLPIKYFHQLQNLYFALTGEELEIKLQGQQA